MKLYKEKKWIGITLLFLFILTGTTYLSNNQVYSKPTNHEQQLVTVTFNTLLSSSIGEPPAQNVKIVLFDGISNRSTITDSNGIASISVPPGIYKYTYQLLDESGVVIPHSTTFSYTWSDLVVNPDPALQDFTHSRKVYVNEDEYLGEFQTFHFAPDEITVEESAGTVTATVYREGSTRGSKVVSYQTLNGSAYAGEHYVKTQGELTFLPGEIYKTIQVPIINNDIYVKDPLIFRLQVNEKGVDNSKQYASITIKDDDEVTGKLEFDSDSTSITVDENSGYVTVTINRVGGSKGTLRFEVFKVGSATPGEDFDALDDYANLYFADGETSKTLTFKIYDDPLKEDFPESIDLTLFRPIDNLGENRQNSTITILDNDY